MPDSFFQSDKKRKRPSRPTASGDRAEKNGGPSKPYEKPYRPAAYGKGQRAKGQAGKEARFSGRSKARDEDLSSDAGGEDGVELDDMDFRAGRAEDGREDEDVIDENETAAEKRVRLARGYLDKVRNEMEAAREDEDYDAAEIDRELIAARLQKEVAEAEGSIHSFISSRISTPIPHRFVSIPGQIPTSIATSSSNIFVSTKRGLVFSYALPSLERSGSVFGQSRVATGKQKAVEGHQGEILCLAASEDGRYLVSGGRDRMVGVWEKGEEGGMNWRAGIKGHKDAVTSLAFPPLNNPSHHILTASLSRHLTLHSLSTLSAIDTFFGHQDSITSVSSLRPTLAVTAGSRDRTCRWWKVEEEVQLVLRGGGRTFEPTIEPAAPDGKENEISGDAGLLEDDEDADPAERKARSKRGRGREFIEGSVDCVCMIDDQRFLSGGDSGSLCLWQTAKKKPIFTKPIAHGIDNLLQEPGQILAGPRWITAIAHLRGTDIFASGSWDGTIKIWALHQSLRSFTLVQTLHIAGFINALHLVALPSSSVDSASWGTSASAGGAEESKESNGNEKEKEILLVAAVAREPRLGRWMKVKEGVKQGISLAHIKLDHEA